MNVLFFSSVHGSSFVLLVDVGEDVAFGVPAQDLLVETALKSKGLSAVSRIVNIDKVAVAAGGYKAVVRTVGNPLVLAVCSVGKHPLADDLGYAVYLKERIF